MPQGKRGRSTTMRNNSAKRSGSRNRSRSANKTAKRPRTSYNEPAVVNISKRGHMEVEPNSFYKKNSPPKVNMSNAARRALLKRIKP